MINENRRRFLGLVTQDDYKNWADSVKKIYSNFNDKTEISSENKKMKNSVKYIAKEEYIYQYALSTQDILDLIDVNQSIRDAIYTKEIKTKSIEEEDFNRKLKEKENFKMYGKFLNEVNDYLVSKLKNSDKYYTSIIEVYIYII